jgi:hypothetical protein
MYSPSEKLYKNPTAEFLKRSPVLDFVRDTFYIMMDYPQLYCFVLAALCKPMLHDCWNSGLP